jgi:hypothetical protein
MVKTVSKTRTRRTIEINYSTGFDFYIMTAKVYDLLQNGTADHKHYLHRNFVITPFFINS